MTIANNNNADGQSVISEKSYVQNEIDLSTLLGNLPGIAYRCRNDEKWTMEFVSAGCFDLTGYHPEDLINNKQLSYAELIDVDDRQRVRMVTQAALLHRQPFRLVYRIQTATGEQKWVWEQGVGILAPDGSVEAIEGFITDITHRKVAEKQLRDSETRFRKIFENSPIGMTIAGPDMRFIKANDAFCRMTGYLEQELMLLTFKDITHPDHLTTDADSVNKLLSGNISDYRTEKRYMRKNGEVMWGSLTLSAVRDEKGGFLHFLSMIEDITERKQAENALRESEAGIRSIFTAAPVGIGLVSNRIILKANERLCGMTGYSQEELLGQSARILYPTEQDFQYVGREKYKQIEERGTGVIETRWKRKDGTIMDVLLSSTPVDPGNLSAGVTFTATDITMLKRMNEELKNHDRLKDEFISTVTHEIRTPLCVFKNVISNAMAGAAGPISPKLRKNLEMADQNIDRLSRIVNDFLDIARIEAGKIQLITAQTNIKTVICEVIEAFRPIAASKCASLDKLLPESDVFIEADRDKLIQILTNLIGNANKFVRAGGHILVTLSDYEDQISISIHDDGPGIEPQRLEKIFDRFELGAASTRSGHPSTGLGLSISKELVEMHKGRIWAASILSRGSTFTFVLPKKQPEKV